MSDPSILLLSGPNLTLFGVRQPEIYGSTTLDDYVAIATTQAIAEHLSLSHFQSDAESELVAAVHDARGKVDAIIVNGGALTHYGWSLRDALASFEGPIVELHVSNPFAREPWRHTSVFSEVASGVIGGFGGTGYELAVQAAAKLLRANV